MKIKPWFWPFLYVWSGAVVLILCAYHAFTGHATIGDAIMAVIYAVALGYGWRWLWRTA